MSLPLYSVTSTQYTPVIIPDYKGLIEKTISIGMKDDSGSGVYLMYVGATLIFKNFYSSEEWQVVGARTLFRFNIALELTRQDAHEVIRIATDKLKNYKDEDRILSDLNQIEPHSEEEDKGNIDYLISWFENHKKQA